MVGSNLAQAKIKYTFLDVKQNHVGFNLLLKR